MGIHHSVDGIVTLDDPDVKFLISLGFIPGMAVEALWRHLHLTLVSPRFHFKFLSARLRANFVTAPLYRRVTAMIFVATLLAIVGVNHAWVYLLIAYALPVTVLYNVSSLLQFLCEHSWLRVRLPGEGKKVHLARLTTGRFCGEATPPKGLSTTKAIFQWTHWTCRMLLIHLPIRISVLVGDLPVHDYHHRHPRSSDWPNGMSRSAVRH